MFLRFDSGFVQIVFNFFRSCRASIGFTAVKNTDCLSLLRLSNSDQSTFVNGVHFESVPDVVDALGKVIRQQYIVLQWWINKITSWTFLNCLEVQEFIGRIRFQAILKYSLLSPLLFAKNFTKASTVHCKVPTNFTLNLSIRSSNLTAPSFSRGIAASCRSDVIMAFDTVKQSWRNLSGLMSVQILSLMGT